ncbi:hypothetical protein EUBSIR_00016 [[Eubacterium] siraeum DSM 15702]|uniref:Uncharacterized protein n=1 Tax=[Eubacterium] siraeum DSM 15702 TaxID=428128 RepID=B0MJP1_9FIRM|nr:hypothetical protein EUBSIR_00016 [[Eubacterium] siraeum DSM 15702]
MQKKQPWGKAYKALLCSHGCKTGRFHRENKMDIDKRSEKKLKSGNSDQRMGKEGDG